MKLRHILIMLILLFLMQPLFAAAITGTSEQLSCIYKHRRYFTLVRFQVSKCAVLGNSPPAVFEAWTLMGVDLRNSEFKDTLSDMESSGPRYSYFELSRIRCHLELWQRNNPFANPGTEITLDLEVPCPVGTRLNNNSDFCVRCKCC